jgi:predicted ribosome quality control (RQC) complex YloA/Tae2 family protein
VFVLKKWFWSAKACFCVFLKSELIVPSALKFLVKPHQQAGALRFGVFQQSLCVRPNFKATDHKRKVENINMTINSTLIFCLIPELKDILLGLRIAKVLISPDQKELLFCLRGRNKEMVLYCSAHPENCRIELWEKDEKEGRKKDYQKTNLFWFATGGYVQKIEQLDFDRVIKISCEKKTQFGAGESFALIFELTGRNSNVVLVRQDEMIVDCLRKIDATRNRLRQILPGEKYLPPPTPEKRNPFLIKKEELEKLIRTCDKPALEWLTSNFMGMDEFLAQKIATQSGLNPKKKTCQLAPDEIEHLRTAFFQTFEQVSNYNLTFQIVINRDGDLKAISCVDLPFVADDQKIYCKNLNSAIKGFFSDKLEREKRKKGIYRLSMVVQPALKKLKKKEKKIEDDLKQAERFEQYKRFGELLMMNKQDIKKGQTSVKLTDMFDPAYPIMEITLDPKLNAIRNAQSYFKKHKKAKEGLRIIKKRRSETKDKIACLEEISSQLEKQDEKVDLEEIRLSLTQLGFLRKTKPPSEKKKRKGFLPKRFFTESGWEICVGRNNKENDYLTFRFARPNDLWFHAQDSPGSHVLLRRKDRKKKPSSLEIKEAAKVAAYFSKVRGEKKAGVIYTQAKFVRKPKGGKPGLALVEREKTIQVKPELPDIKPDPKLNQVNLSEHF